MLTRHSLGQVTARSKELHILADPHSRHTAGDAIVAAKQITHHGVRLILDAASVNGRLGTEALEVQGQFLIPEHCTSATSNTSLNKHQAVHASQQHSCASC